MTVTIPVSLTPEEQQALLSQAKAAGISVDTLLRRAVLQVIAAPLDSDLQRLTTEQWEKEARLDVIII